MKFSVISPGTRGVDILISESPTEKCEVKYCLSTMHYTDSLSGFALANA